MHFLFWLDLTWLGKFFALFSGQGVVLHFLPFSPFVSLSVCLSVCFSMFFFSVFADLFYLPFCLFVSFFVSLCLQSYVTCYFFFMLVPLLFCPCLQSYVSFFSFFVQFIYFSSHSCFVFSLCVFELILHNCLCMFLLFHCLLTRGFFFIFKKNSQNCQLLLPQINRLRSKIWFLGEKA